MAQTWSNLLFAHWPIKPDVMRSFIPPGLTLDTFAGEAWVGIVPFLMSRVKARRVPFVPDFCELNVRTYVTYKDKPGVWFFSLDASNPLAVFGARQLFHLPYFNAQMSCIHNDDRVEYASRRQHFGASAAEFAARYQPASPVFRSQPGTLEYWLTERYCLYSVDRHGQLYRGDIHHAPWPLQTAEAEIVLDTMAASHGLSLPDTPPLLHFARRLDVVAWYLQQL